MAFTSTFLSSNLKENFSLIKALNWFEADLQMLLIWWFKFSLPSISIPKILTLGRILVNSFGWSVFNIYVPGKQLPYPE